MASLGTTEVVIVLIIVVVLFGGSRLPRLGAGLGSAIRNFREGIGGSAQDANGRDT